MSFIRKALPLAIGTNGSRVRMLDIRVIDSSDEFGGNPMDALLEHASALEVVLLDLMPCMTSESTASIHDRRTRSIDTQRIELFVPLGSFLSTVGN